MKRTKTNKGITLVALIITIVVLLILAVVAIGAVKDSNIIAHAQKASNDYTIEQEKEQIGIAVSEWQLQKNISGNTKKFKEVIAGALASIANVEGNDDGPLTVTFKTGNHYIVKDNGEIVSAEQPVVQTAKAFLVQDGVIGVLSPSGDEVAAFSQSSALPLMSGTEIENVNSLESNNIYITIDAGIDYKKLLYVEANKAVCALSTDGNGIYFGTGSAGEDGNVTILVTTAGYLPFDDSIDITQYYQEDVYYHMPQYGTKNEIICSIANGICDLKFNAWFPITFAYKGVISSDETTTVQADGSEITIREGAQKFEVTGEPLAGTLIAYLQDDNLYFMDRCGTPTRFINTGALPTE